MKFESSEDLARKVQELLDARDFDGALALVKSVDDDFPDDPLAHHLAGLVWERTYIEGSAEGAPPPLTHYEKAEHHYRRAMKLDAANSALHAERLYACLFILGTQFGSLARLQEALGLADTMSAELGPEGNNAYEREAVIVASAIARHTQKGEDWEEASRRFDLVAPPEGGGREAYFFHHYRGLVKRELARSQDRQDFLLEAIESLRAALELHPSRGIEYLLADCLAQLQKPSRRDVLEMMELAAKLEAGSPADVLVRGLAERCRLRARSFEENEGESL